MRLILPIALAAASFATAASAAEPLSLADSFRIGTEGNAICTAQVAPADGALVDMFDRGYAILCRDAAVPVGNLYALRTRAGDPAPRLSQRREERVACASMATAPSLGLTGAMRADCTLKEHPVEYRVYAYRRGGTLFVAEGLAGYEDALILGLRSLVADEALAGSVSVATTGIGDPTAFARALAANISPQRALAEAYRRNNGGNYAEAAEFFASLSGDSSHNSRAEALVNEALQKSNLGAFSEADMLFAQAEAFVRGDPVVERQLRNYRAMHFLNLGMVAEAKSELSRPMKDASPSLYALRELVIDESTATLLSNESANARRLGGGSALSPQDRAQILDAQALQLRGSALRLQGNDAEAVAAFRQAQTQLQLVRDGRVAATQWMQAQILAELADISEGGGDFASAESRYRDAVLLLETHYPGSSALRTAQGELASFYARRGRSKEALAAVDAIVGANPDGGIASPSLRRMLAAYFDLLTRPAAPPDASQRMFRASQMLIRPGVAQTQAILARDLGGGSDEASRLFRQALNLSREVERLRTEHARLRAAGGDAARLDQIRAALTVAEEGQVATQAQLAQFPRYRAISNGVISLQDLQAVLTPGEAYYKMVVAGDDVFALLISPESVRAWKLAGGAGDLERMVDAVRDSISTVEDGQLITYPFDLLSAHRLYGALFDGAGNDLAGVRRLVFEPDGAMLRLPPNLLVMNQASVDAYNARISQPGSDEFDFTGVAWLGRDRDVSTAVSPRAFRDIRLAAPSQASAQYIGFGQNKPADAFFLPTASVATADACSWSLATWGRPISADELTAASRVVGADPGSVITGANFTDEAIKERTDLDQYRIVHFATHGLLAPPRPECPARPALMTSFGGGSSDGLLSFGEIFDLQLDADVVILSACDTAASASTAANIEAGLTNGGEFTLDGLVRAFVGAGGRLVVASHWPVPDTFDATQRLIGGLFEARPGTSTASALREAQRQLMDDPMTSHPFYWSAFALVGDGATPLIRPTARLAGLGE